MKNNRNATLILFGTLLCAGTSLFAQPSESDLMKQAKIAKAQAENIAKARVPNANIQSEEIENEHKVLVWSFDMVEAGDKNVTEVLVDAKTGKIVSVNTETPADQAKERAADQASGQR